MAEVVGVVMRIYTVNGCHPIGEIRDRREDVRPGAVYKLGHVLAWRN